MEEIRGGLLVPVSPVTIASGWRYALFFDPDRARYNPAMAVFAEWIGGGDRTGGLGAELAAVDPTGRRRRPMMSSPDPPPNADMRSMREFLLAFRRYLSASWKKS